PPQRSLLTLYTHSATVRRSSLLTQAELARAASLDRTARTKIERGGRNVGSLELVRIARALRLPVDRLLADSAPARKRGFLELKKRRRAITDIAARHGARSVRVFGSIARGEARPESDIDLLVKMGPGRSLLDQAALLVELQDLLGRDVDIVTDEGLRGRIRGRVLREPVPLSGTTARGC